MAIPVPEAPRWRNHAVVRDTDARGTRRLWVLLLSVGLAITPFIAYLVEVREYVQVNRQIDAVRRDQERLREAQHRLRIDRAQRQSLAEVEKRAESDLGLEHPAPGDVIVLKGSASAPRPVGR